MTRWLVLGALMAVASLAACGPTPTCCERTAVARERTYAGRFSIDGGTTSVTFVAAPDGGAQLVFTRGGVEITESFTVTTP